jgi:hypothetical protein
MVPKSRGDEDHGQGVLTAPRGLDRHPRGAAGAAVLARRGGGLRAAGPAVPLALRDAVQLRPHLGPPRRKHLVRAHRRLAAVRGDGLRRGRPRPRRRRPAELRRRPQGAGAVRDVGAARRDPAHRRPRAPSRRRAEAAAAGRPAGLPPQPHPGHRALPPAPRQMAGRAPHARHAVREARHRRVGRRFRFLAGAGAGRGGLVRRRRSARARDRGRGRADARARGRGAGVRGHGVAGERRRARGLEPGLDRLRPRDRRGRNPRRLRAVDADGAVPPPRLERGLRRRRHRSPTRRQRTKDRAGDRQRAADGGGLPHHEGVEIRDPGARVARRGTQALLGRIRRGAGPAPVRRGGDAAAVPAGRLPLRGGEGQGDAGGVLPGRAAGFARGGAARPRVDRANGGAADRGSRAAGRAGARAARRGARARPRVHAGCAASSGACWTT